MKKLRAKHAAAPRVQIKKPTNRSHLDRAKYASSSFERSFERNGIPDERAEVKRENDRRGVVVLLLLLLAAAESSVVPCAHRTA